MAQSYHALGLEKHNAKSEASKKVISYIKIFFLRL
jgi:hypothetical protein